jgi:hypothetical protein
VNMIEQRRRIRAAAALSTSALLVLSGCATTQLDGQWTDPQVSGTPLRGASVYVACDAQEPLVQQVCQDQMAAQLGTLGASAVIGSAAPAEQTMAAARAAGAKAVMNVAVSPDVAVAEGSGISFGLGLGGFGRSSFGGVGISAPIGGTRVNRGYVANSTITEVASGRVMWTAKASARPSEDVNGQVSELARVTGEAARKAGLF